jgi:PEP-CTERM motif
MPLRKALLVVMLLIGTAYFSQQARADSVLLNSPSANFNYYGMYCTSCLAASFTLGASYNVSTIDVVLETPAATSFTTFDFSLQNSLTGPITTLASAALTAPLGGASTEVMNIGETLAAGTYYLVGNVPGYAGTSVIPGNVDGWFVSNGIYNNTAGTVTNGLWGFNGSTWVLESGNYFNNGTLYNAPAFTVNGSPVTSTPEPSTLLLLGTGLLGLVGAAKRKWFVS